MVPSSLSNSEGPGPGVPVESLLPPNRPKRIAPQWLRVAPRGAKEDLFGVWAAPKLPWCMGFFNGTNPPKPARC